MSGKGYPTQPRPYPVQQNNVQFAYPQAQPWQPSAPPMYGMPNEAPPPYSYQPPPQQPQMPAGYQMYPQTQNVQLAGPGGMVSNGQVAMASFDSGARFDGISQPRIPPPPPGCMPTAAQQAVMQGRPIVAQQQKANWFSGSGGGYTWGGL
ncbi:DAZ-associated protein 2-like [Saccostrea echinata]|uniref:DAZ-associated protein 2-like n=1 Tax=Saccostrea echinata TaxID=191078 RepID=UPI002A83660B|nr:DAZ-associated protein 2-like [Saccostrea echinata]